MPQALLIDIRLKYDVAAERPNKDVEGSVRVESKVFGKKKHPTKMCG